MKIRIKGNSIRFRLAKSEIDYFKEECYLEEKTEFGKNSFAYALMTKESGDELSAEFLNGTITMFIPKLLAKEWTTTEKVGFENEMEIGGGKKLFLLLEKDYKCLDAVAEDQSDNYENPGKISRQ